MADSTDRDPIVIAGYARTPDGRLSGRAWRGQGDRAGRGRGPSGGRARRRRAGRRSTRSSWAACCPRASARRRRARRRMGAGLPLSRRGHHRQQDVRLRHAGGDPGPRRAGRRLRPRSSSPAAWRACPTRRTCLAKHRAGARIGHDRVARLHVPRRARGRLRARQADGRLRRGDGGGLPDHAARPWTPTRSRASPRARARRRRRRFRARDRRRSSRGPRRGRRRSATTSSR